MLIQKVKTEYYRDRRLKGYNRLITHANKTNSLLRTWLFLTTKIGYLTLEIALLAQHVPVFSQ